MNYWEHVYNNILEITGISISSISSLVLVIIVWYFTSTGEVNDGIDDEMIIKSDDAGKMEIYSIV